MNNGDDRKFPPEKVEQKALHSFNDKEVIIAKLSPSGLVNFTGKIVKHGVCISQADFGDLLIDSCVVDPVSILKDIFVQGGGVEEAAMELMALCVSVNPQLHPRRGIFFNPSGVVLTSSSPPKGFSPIASNNCWDFPLRTVKYSGDSFLSFEDLSKRGYRLVYWKQRALYLAIKMFSTNEIEMLSGFKNQLHPMYYRILVGCYGVGHYHSIKSLLKITSPEEESSHVKELYAAVVQQNPALIMGKDNKLPMDLDDSVSLELKNKILEDIEKFIEEESEDSEDTPTEEEDKQGEGKLFTTETGRDKKGIHKLQTAGFESVKTQDIVTLGKRIKAQVFGQDDAVDKLVAAIKRAKVGLTDGTKPIATAILTGQTGSGKAQPLDSLVLSPHGWIKMGDIKIGDIILSEKLEMQKVDGVFPQGKKNIVRIAFSDGREVECCEDHLWRCYNKQWHPRWQVLSVKEILQRKSLNSSGIYVELISPSRDDYRSQLFIDPYIMGLLLGDGGITQNTVRFSNAEDDILEELSSRLKAGYKLKKLTGKYDYIISSDRQGTFYKDELEDLGLMGKKSTEKFVPEKYKNADYVSRLELIRGLMDTDGTCDAKGGISFSSSSKQLALDLQELIWSIGGIASISEKKPFFRYKGEIKEGLISYRVNIRHNDRKILFSSKKKLARLGTEYQYEGRVKLKIVSVESVGEKEAQCIKVSGPSSLYVTDGYVVTHNTHLAKILCDELVKDKKALVRIDCGEYGLEHEAMKLLGSPPSFVGYEDGGYLTNKLIQYPFCVVLFDEIEKAHPRMYDILLQVFDDARLTDGKGKTVSFNQAIIIMTSNLGSRELDKEYGTIPSLGFGSAGNDANAADKIVSHQLKRHFKPEFINRIDEVIVFKPLTVEVSRKIAAYELGKLRKLLVKKGYKVLFDDSVLDYLVNKGFSKEYGARPLIRTIKKDISDRLADNILASSMEEMDKVIVYYQDNDFVFERIPASKETKDVVDELERLVSK